MLAFQSKLIQRAAEICGGYDQLCARLGVNENKINFWAKGKARMPDAMFLQVTDIVLEDDIARARQDRRGIPRVAALREPKDGGAPSHT